MGTVHAFSICITRGLLVRTETARPITQRSLARIAMLRNDEEIELVGTKERPMLACWVASALLVLGGGWGNG